MTNLTMLISVVSMLCLLMTCPIRGVDYASWDESYLSDVNLERFYLLEENVVSNADALVRKDFFGAEEEETEEEHRQHAMNLTEVKSMLSKVKGLHRKVGPSLWDYLGHPINMFRLFRRLHADWSKGLDLLLTSTPCKLWKVGAMRRYLSFLRHNVPGEKDHDHVIDHMLRLQRIMGDHVQDVANGKIGNVPATEPLGTDDLFSIGKVLYEREDYAKAIPWLEMTSAKVKTLPKHAKTELTFNETDLLQMLGTGYYLLGRLDEAVNATHRRLDLDLSNSRVVETLNFFIRKRMKLQIDRRLGGDDTDSDSDSDSDATPKRKHRKGRKQRPSFDKICAGQVFKLSRQHCTFESVVGRRSYYVIKKEILRQKPPVIIFHDVIHSFAMSQLVEFSRSKLTNGAWMSDSSFTTPQMSISLDYKQLPKNQKNIKYATQKLGQALTQLPPLPITRTVGWGATEIVNVGRSGTHFSKYADKMDLVSHGHVKTAVMFAFLSEPQKGGEMVLRKHKVFSSVPKGSVVFYQPKGRNLHSLCPSLGSSQWVVVQPVFVKEKKICPTRS